MKIRPKPGLERAIYDLTKRRLTGVNICKQLKYFGIKEVSSARVSQIQKYLGLRESYKKPGRPKSIQYN